MGRHIPSTPIARGPGEEKRFPRWSAERAEAMFGPALPVPAKSEKSAGQEAEGTEREGDAAVPKSPVRLRTRMRTRTGGEEAEMPRTPETRVGDAPAPRTPERPIRRGDWGA